MAFSWSRNVSGTFAIPFHPVVLNYYLDHVGKALLFLSHYGLKPYFMVELMRRVRVEILVVRHFAHPKYGVILRLHFKYTSEKRSLIAS